METIEKVVFNKKEFKKIEDIFSNEQISEIYFCNAVYTAAKAITQFIKEEETEKGAIILSASPKKNKDTGEELFSGYLKWKYPEEDFVYYVQFNSNPFFSPHLDMTFYTKEKKEYYYSNKYYYAHDCAFNIKEKLFNNVNPYDYTNENNIKTLVDNIRSGIKEIKKHSNLTTKRELPIYKKPNKQEIYYI